MLPKGNLELASSLLVLQDGGKMFWQGQFSPGHRQDRQGRSIVKHTTPIGGF